VSDTVLRTEAADLFGIELPEPDPRALAVAALVLAAGLAVRLQVPRALRARPIYGTLSLVLAGSLVAAPAGGGGNPAGVVTRWYISDPVGSTTLVVGATGEVSRRKVDPFGLVGPQAWSEETHRRYGGQRVEPVTELADFRARWYDPESGRFLSADPLIAAPFDPQQHNAFAYARGNPLRYTDPTGMGAEQALCSINPGLCILAIGFTLFNLFGDAEAEADEGIPVFLGPAGPPGSGLEINVKVDLPEMRASDLSPSQSAQLESAAYRRMAEIEAAKRTTAQNVDIFLSESGLGTKINVAPVFLGTRAARSLLSVVLNRVSSVERAIIRVRVARDVTPNPRIYAQLEKQLTEAGPDSIRRALSSAEKTLLEHQRKLEWLEQHGDYTSAVEKTIRNVRRQIETIKRFMLDHDL
jgi:RHS repeat-associated protein